MTVDDVLHQREPQPRAPLLAAGGRIHPVEALRQTREMLGGNPWPIVANRELDGRSSALARIEASDLNLNPPSARAILDGVLDDVLGHAHQFIRVPKDPAS